MKLKRRTEYDKIYYDMPQKVRVAIPLESYNQLKKMVYRNPKYWVDDISRKALWLFLTLFKAQLVTYLLCLFWTIEVKAFVVNSEYLWNVLQISKPLGYVLFLASLSLPILYGMYPFNDAVFNEYLDDLIEQEYESALIPIRDVPAINKQDD